jgi:LPXTG-motif cell wall-anchored protein
LPKSGLGEDLLLLAGGIILVAIVFLARRARTSAG